MIASDAVFAGSIPRLYDELLVPMLFEGYARDLVRRVAARRPARVLEIAAGTGAVTRRLAAALPETTALVATDLNPGMLERAQQVGASRPVTWRQADAQQLPFEAASFDAVVCQFGAMFFPDKGGAFAEMRRVLRPGGAALFSVWDRLEDNEFAECVNDAVAALFPDDPPRFMARVPHGYWSRDQIERDLAAGGFGEATEIATVTEASRADGPRAAAVAFCQGTPLRSEIERRDPAGLEPATDAAEAALAARFGTGGVTGKMQALVVTVER